MIDKVDITFKLRYDWSSKIIKVTWYSKWYARGSSKAAYVDATSSFHLDENGKIFKHVVDRVQVGGRPFSPPYSVGWLAFREYVLAGLDVPSPVPSFGFEASEDAQDALVLMSASDGEASEEPPKKKKAPRAKEKKQKRKLLPGQCEGMWDCDRERCLRPKIDAAAAQGFPRSSSPLVARSQWSAGPPGMLRRAACVFKMCCSCIPRVPRARSLADSPGAWAASGGPAASKGGLIPAYSHRREGDLGDYAPVQHPRCVPPAIGRAAGAASAAPLGVRYDAAHGNCQIGARARALLHHQVAESRRRRPRLFLRATEGRPIQCGNQTSPVSRREDGLSILTPAFNQPLDKWNESSEA